MKKKMLIITGPAHSGTSLVAKIVHENYASLGDNLQFNGVAPHIGYEDVSIYNAILQILNESGIEVKNSSMIDPDKIPEPPVSLISNTNIPYVPAFKAPYASFILHYFMSKFDCYVIVTERNKEDNIKSFMNREKMPREKAKKLLSKFKEHLDFCLNNSDIKTISVHFEKLLEKDKIELKKMEDFIKGWKE